MLKNTILATMTLLLASNVAIADDTLSIKDGTYILQVGDKFLGSKVFFDLNDGNTIDLPRGEFKIQNTGEGTLVVGRVSMYRGINIEINQMCIPENSQIICKVVSNAKNVDDIAKALETAPKLTLTKTDDNSLLLNVEEGIGEGGTLDNVNKYHKYKLK